MQKILGVQTTYKDAEAILKFIEDATIAGGFECNKLQLALALSTICKAPVAF